MVGIDRRTGEPPRSSTASCRRRRLRPACRTTAIPAGYRKWLGQRGVVYGLEYTNDVLSNVHGGLRTGTIDQGKLHGILTVDFGKLAGWDGLTFFANFFQIHNTGRIRRDYVGGINTIAAIEAVPTTRLSELWLEQSFAGRQGEPEGRPAHRRRRVLLQRSQPMFLQSDWPTIAAVNLPSGGAAYPLSTPGVRLKFDPVKNVWLLFAVLNGDPAGPGPGDEQMRNRYGLNFRVNDPPFVIGEAQFQHNNGKKDEGLATTLKLGAWGHFGQFNDQRFAIDGTLAGRSRGLRHAAPPSRQQRSLCGDRPAALPAQGRRRAERHFGLHPRVDEPVRPQPDRPLHRRRHRVRAT